MTETRDTAIVLPEQLAGAGAPEVAAGARRRLPYAARRILTGVLTVLGVSLLVFVMFRMVSNPARVALGVDATPEQEEAFNSLHGFDDPIVVQFGRYLSELVRLDFGDSLWQGRSTLAIVGETIPRTAQLVIPAISLAFLAALAMGTAAARRPDGWLDRAIVSLSLVGVSVPAFWSGLLLSVIFGVTLGWLPTSGLGGWRYMLLPGIALALPHLGRLVMITRSTMLDELNRQWVTAAHARGIPEGRVKLHAMRNSLIPIITVASGELTIAIAGTAVLVETVFAWPGVGFTMIQAIRQRDIFLVQTFALVLATLVVGVNIAVDLLYPRIDPRVRLER